MDETARVRAVYDKLASGYDRSVAWFERLLVGDGRRWVCGQARGDVLEVAVGTGRNLPFYPADVQLTGIELSPAMLALARDRAATLGRAIDLRIGDAQALDFPDRCFDSVVFTLALCTIPDDRKALAEAVRVLRPGGMLLLLEHVDSNVPIAHAVLRLLDPLTVRFQADHLVRLPLRHLQRQGLVIERLERSRLGIILRVAARKPA